LLDVSSDSESYSEQFTDSDLSLNFEDKNEEEKYYYLNDKLNEVKQQLDQMFEEIDNLITDISNEERNTDRSFLATYPILVNLIKQTFLHVKNQIQIVENLMGN